MSSPLELVKYMVPPPMTATWPAVRVVELSPDVAAEAIADGVGMIVTHHPVMFRPIQQITEATPEGAGVSFGTHIVDAEVDPETGSTSAARRPRRSAGGGRTSPSARA